MKTWCAFLAVSLAAFAYWHIHRPITYSAGVLISGEPQQLDLIGDDNVIEYRDFHLKPLAHLSLDARVLHRRIYRYDRQAALVPVDLALGWGPMSDQHVLDQLRITQSMRFYWYEYKMPPPISPGEIISHSTNLHVIPSTPSIAACCKSFRTGSLIHLTGDLVEATGPNIGTWRSSLSRTDTGNGACELMWVREASILPETGLETRQSLVKGW